MPSDARRYLVAVALLLGAAVGVRWQQASRVPAAARQVDFAAVPLALDGFRGQEMPVDEATRSYLKPDAMSTRVYRGGGRELSMSLIYARDWREIHNPALCFPAQGWQILDEKELDIPRPAGAPIRARSIHCARGKAELVAVFVFAYPGGSTGSWPAYATAVAMGPRGAGGLIINTQTATLGSDVPAATEALGRLVAATYPYASAIWKSGG